MANKKNFLTANTSRVYSAIAEATAEPAQQEEQAQQTRKPRKTYTAQEAQEMQAAGTTRGRKGIKQLRINMAFTPEIHDYIRTMAGVRGETVTEFTNAVFKRSMEENAELYEQAKAFHKKFK